jgi:metal-sulfur cluster biosynthetic enzyme
VVPGTEEVLAALRHVIDPEIGINVVDLQHIRGVTSVTVDLVWQPPWQPSMMTATARERLGWRSSRP